MDGDADIDVLSASYYDDKIAWYENDGSENFTAHTIATNANGAESVFAIDVDGDADIDVLSASYYDDKIAWYENDGQESFTTHIITTDSEAARSVFAIDVDGDDDIDVFSASYGDDKIAWYENDGSENFSAHTINSSANGAVSVFAIDVDGDADIDVLSASWLDAKIAWYENLGVPNFSLSLGSYNPPIVIPAGGGSFQFDCLVQNNDSIAYTFDGWIEALKPDSSLISPIALRSGLILAPGENMFWNDLTQYVPASAPAGEYTYIAKSGIFADSVIASDSFTFEKLAGDDSGSDNNEWTLTGWGETSEPISGNIPAQYRLGHNYPNPFNPTTTVTFDLPEAGLVSLIVYDIQGREVARLADGIKPAGSHQITFDGSELSSGVYFAKMEAGDFRQTRKMLLIK